MNTTQMLATLVDAARQMPENRHLNAAIRHAEKKMGRILEKRERRENRQLGITIIKA